MSSLPESPRWSLLIYRVSGDGRQQRILQAFHRIASPGITVLGTESGPERFVIVDCASMTHELRARRIILEIDAGANRVLRTKVPLSTSATRDTTSPTAARRPRSGR